METGFLVLLVLLFIAGFFSILFGFPGTWVIVAAAGLYGWGTRFETVTLSLLAILAVMATAGEVVEYLFGVAGARRLGASKKGAFFSIVGGLIGAVLGAPIFFGLGALIGLFAGAFVGAFGYELIRYRNLMHSFKSGVGALIGRASGTATKLLLALTMIVVVLLRIF
ncbi:MAG: DUF456 domain-containing protein [bacterium]|nr:DUF456 domain-containing protein [bacterium]